MHSNLRVIHSPDSMFFIAASEKPKREDFLRLAQRLTVTKVKIEQEEFRYQCNELGLKCSMDRAKNGFVQPPCCLEIFAGMKLVVGAEMIQQKLDYGCMSGMASRNQILKIQYIPLRSKKSRQIWETP